MKDLMTHKTIFTLIFVAILLTACKNKNQGTKPAMKSLMEAVYASGFVISKDEYEITSQVEGYVSNKLVQDGDAVKKGDPLYVIDSDQQSARNRIAYETYELASKNYREN